VKCGTCGTYNVFDIEENMGTKVCKTCNEDLTSQAIPEPMHCEYCGEICYNPCKKAKTVPAAGPLECRLRRES